MTINLRDIQLGYLNMTVRVEGEGGGVVQLPLAPNLQRVVPADHPNQVNKRRTVRPFYRVQLLCKINCIFR